MTAASKIRIFTRWSTVTLMGAAVMTATADGFVQSYAGLYHWALEHGLTGWKAQSFPLMVDLFIVVGELGLFLLAIDAYRVRRKQMLSWLDFLLPGLIAAAGWTASLIFNIGHVQSQEFSYQATAAVPPIVSMLGLLVLLRTLHRYVAQQEEADREREEIRARVAAEFTAAAEAEKRAAAAARPEARDVDVPAAQQPVAEPERTDAEPERTDAGAPGEPQPVEAAAQQAVAAGAPAEREPDGLIVLNDDTPAPQLVVSAAGPADRGEPAARANGSGPSTGPMRLSLMEGSRDLLLDELDNHHGDVAAALVDMEGHGFTFDREEARKIRDNQWLTYLVYRMLARYEGDIGKVRAALDEQHIECSSTLLDDLAQSWRA